MIAINAMTGQVEVVDDVIANKSTPIQPLPSIEERVDVIEPKVATIEQTIEVIFG